MKNQLIQYNNGTVTFRCKQYTNKGMITKECSRVYCKAFDKRIVKGQIKCEPYKSKNKTGIRLLTLEWIDYISYVNHKE